MANNSDLNKLQDLFSRLSEESQDLVFKIMYALAPVNELPKGKSLFDIAEQEDSIEKLKQTGFVKTDKLDDFNTKEEPVKIISKQEAFDIDDFNTTISEPEKKKVSTKEAGRRGRTKGSLTDGDIIRFLKKSGNKEDKNSIKITEKLDPNMETIDSLYVKYCKEFGEAKAIEMGWKIVPEAKALQEATIANEKIVGNKKAWEPVFQEAGKLGYPREKGIAYLGACIVIAANKLGFPI